MRRPVLPLAVSTALLGLLASGLAALAPATAAGAAADPATPLRYVALGDSYSAASGVLPPDPAAPPQCLRSLRNYPHVLAARLGAALTDVTCGGADTGDYAEGQYPGVAPQLDALRPDTQLVTMTIGGNDSSVFIGAILQCGTLGVASLGVGSPCADADAGARERTVRDVTYPALVAALTAVRQRAPQARVLVLGYPQIMPATGGCFPVMPIAAGDVPYLRRLQATLNDAVARAANATGATFVDTSAASEGHDACQPIGTRWIEPVLLGTNPVIVHPNALGESQLAALALAALSQTAPALVPTGAAARVPTRTTQRLAKQRGQRARPLVVTVSTRPGSGPRTRITGARVVLQARTSPSQRWRKVRVFTTDEDGRAQARPRPARATTYRWTTRPSTLISGSRSEWIRLPRRR